METRLLIALALYAVAMATVFCVISFGSLQGELDRAGDILARRAAEEAQR